MPPTAEGKIIVEIARLPIKAPTIWLYSASNGGRLKGITIISPTQSAAPLLMPNKPGSASGLRNNPCIMVPETANAHPTTTANNTRGRRIFNQMCHMASLVEVFHSVRNESDKAPILAEPSARMTSNISKKPSISRG